MARARSGQVTVTTSGTAVQGPTFPGAANNKRVRFYIKAHPGNTDTVWIGEDGGGDVASGNGFPLNVGEGMEVELNSLSELWFDASSSGDIICWFAVS